MIMYKVNNPNRTLQVPTIIWDTYAGIAALEEISVGNEWQITNLGTALALWNPVRGMTTLTVNFNDSTVGKNFAVTVASNDRDLVGVQLHVFTGDEWQEEVNAALQSAMFNYFVDNGEWTLNENGIKGASSPGFSEGRNIDDAVFEKSDAVCAIDAVD